jgi:large subunit ribosomal protein L10
MNKTAKVPEAKKKVVKEIIDLAKRYNLIGAVDMENLPTKQLQNMRAQLRSTVVLKMTKRRLMVLALTEAAKTKPGLEALIPMLKGMPALIFTNDNPFALCKTLDKNKSSAPIKGGQKAPHDIIVPAGPTGFAPGPIIGQLGQAGIAAGIDAGKVIVKKDSKVAKEGDIIKPELAAILLRLNIHPMEIGLNLTAAYENGVVFGKEVLSVDEKQYIANITQAHTWAFNLAVETGILTKETTELLVTKAYRNAKAVALESGFPADGVIPDLLAKAHNQMLGVKALVD